MRKKGLIVSIIGIVIMTLIGCGDTSTNNDNEVDTHLKEELEAEKDNEEVIKGKLDELYKNILDMNEKSQYIVDNVFRYWDTDGAWTFEGLFDKSYGASAKQSWKDMRDNVFLYRENIAEYQSSINKDFKAIEVTEKLEDYKKALGDLYVEVNAFATIAVEYPEGYNKISYSQMINEHKTNFEKLRSVVELNK